MKLVRKVAWQQTISYVFEYGKGFIVVDDEPTYVASGYTEKVWRIGTELPTDEYIGLHIVRAYEDVARRTTMVPKEN